MPVLYNILAYYGYISCECIEIEITGNLPMCLLAILQFTIGDLDLDPDHYICYLKTDNSSIVHLISRPHCGYTMK